MTPMGDDSFAAFYTASYQRLLGQLFAVTGDLAEAENLLQEAYARAVVRWAQVRAPTTARRRGSGGWR
jgi:RNA polymerase sigma-70 factor (ECF subfamily)